METRCFFTLLIVRVASCIHSMGIALGSYLPGFQYACGGELLSRLHILRTNVYIIMYSPLSESCPSSMIHSCVETWCNKCSISFLEQLTLITLASLPSYKAESTEVVLSFGCTINMLFLFVVVNFLSINSDTFNQYCRIVVISLFFTKEIINVKYLFQWLVIHHPCLQNVWSHTFVQSVRTQ